MRLPGLKLTMLRDLAALSGGEVVGRVAGFVAFAYLARALGPESYGAVEFAVALSLLFNCVVDLGVGQIGAREISRDPGCAPSLAAEIPAARMLVALLAIPAMGATAVIMGQPPETVRLVWVFALALLAAPWRQEWLFQGLEMMSWVSAAGVLRMLLFVLGVALLVRTSNDLVAVGVVEILSATCLAGYFMVLQQRRVTSVRISFSPPAMRRLMREGLPLALTQVVWSTTQYLPVMLVAGFLGGVVIAWFGAAHRVVMSLWVFSWLYHFNLFPAIARSLAESRESFLALVSPSLKVTAWAGFGVALVVALLGEPICRLMFGEPFAVAGATLSVLVWIVPSTLLSGHARSALVAQGLQRYVLFAQTSGAVVMLVAGVALIPRAGALGAAIAMALASLVVLATSYYFATRRIVKIPLLAEVVRPTAAAIIAALAVRAAGLGPWWDAAGGALIFAAGGLLLDDELIPDMRRLAVAKGRVDAS